jgi:hypothetical protein
MMHPYVKAIESIAAMDKGFISVENEVSTADSICCKFCVSPSDPLM